jgi:hypothetical protein
MPKVSQVDAATTLALRNKVGLPAPLASYFLRGNVSGTAFESAPAVYDLGNFLQYGTGAVSQSAVGKIAEWRSITDYSPDSTPITTASSPTRIRQAIQLAFDSGAGDPIYVLIPPGVWEVDLPPNVPSNVQVLLFGTIYNAGHAADATCCALTMGTHAPAFNINATLYTAPSVIAGASQFVLDAGANRTNGIAAMPVGTPLYIRSKTYVLQPPAGGGADITIPTYIGMGMCTGSDAGTGTITFEPPVDEAIANVMVGPADQPAIGLKSAYRSSIVGPGGLKSDTYYATAYGGQLQCTVDIGFIESYGGLFGNLFCHGSYKVRNVWAKKKIHDTSFGSNNSSFEVISAYCDNSVDTSTGQILVSGQHGRRNTVKYGSVSAPNYNGNSGFILYATGCHNCTLDVGTIDAPLAAGKVVLMSNAVETVAGDEVQHYTTDCSFACDTLNVSAGAAARYVYLENLNSGGARNKVLRGHYSGVVSTSAIEVYGTDTYIGQNVRCDSGALLVKNGATLSCDGAYFAGGVTFDSATSLANQNIRNIRSTAQAVLRAAYCSGQNVATSAAVAAITGGTMVIAAGGLVVGDTVEVEWSGKLAGTNDVKTVTLADNTGTLATIAYIAADVNGIRGRAQFRVASDAIYGGDVIMWDGSTPALTRVRRTAMTLNASGRTFTLQAGTANAGDSVTIDQFTMRVVRPSANLP